MLHLNNHFINISTATLHQSIDKTIIDNLVKTLTQKQQAKDKCKALLLINLEAVCGLKHLKACIHFAIKAFQQKTNTAKFLGPEILLYLAGRRQINKAIKNVGLSAEISKVLMIEVLTDRISKTENLEVLLSDMNVKFSDCKSSIDDFNITNYTTIKKNLEISDNMVKLIAKNDTPNEYYYALQKLAIERSAALDLNK